MGLPTDQVGEALGGRGQDRGIRLLYGWFFVPSVD